MQPQIEQQVEALRARVAKGRADLDAAKAKFGGVNDTYLNTIIKQATFWLDDTENFFIAMLKKDEHPPRSINEELMIVTQASLFLNKFTLPTIERIGELADQYGPRFMSIGG